VRECLIKCLQIVLHSRLLSPASDAHLPVNKTFNLHTPEAGITHAEWDERMRGKEGQVIVLDVLLSSSSSSASPVLLERWSLHHDVDDLFASAPLSASSSSRRVDPSLMFKRMLLLCRSLYSYVRLLPAASLAKQAHTYVEHDYSPPFTLHYSLHTSSHASAAAFISSPASYSFTPIITPRGSFNLHVLYLSDLSFFSFPPVKRAMASELMEDYMTRVQSSPALAADVRGRRLSVPVMPSSAAFPSRAATVTVFPSSSSVAPSSLPASLSGPALVDRYSPVTNTPPFSHGSPPTPSQYPPSLSDTPPFSSLPPSPHAYGLHMQMSHSHSSPVAISPPVLPAVHSPSSSGHASSPPIAIPIPHSRSSSQSSRSLSSHSPVPIALARGRAASQSSSLSPAAAPTTGLSLLSQPSVGYGLPPPPSSSSSPLSRPLSRDAQLGQLLSWMRELPPLQSVLVPAETAAGIREEGNAGSGVVNLLSVDDTLRELDVLLQRNAELKARVAAVQPQPKQQPSSRT
jgi:hypothetical protein